MNPAFRTAFALLLLCGVLGTSARAERKPVKEHPPLVELPHDKLVLLAPLLRAGDFALLESDSRGWEKQITTITLAKAPPEVVRDVVIHPEKYQDFTRNMSGRDVKQNPDGTFDHKWKLSYTLASFDGVNRYKLLPPREGEPVGDVEMADPTGMSIYHWQFLPAANGGGTIVVLYGFTDMRHSGGFIDKVLARADTLEHGLALITQMTMHRAMCAEAEKRHQPFAPYVAPASGSPTTSYRFLLERGALAILRHEGDKLVGLSLTERSPAAKESLLDEYSHPERWKYVPSYTRVQQRDPMNGLPVVEIEQTIVALMSWTTSWGVRPSGGGVDLFGLSGDLKDARMRFDFRDEKADGKNLVEITLRAQLDYDRNSVILRQLFKVEPLFQDGVNVGLSLVVLRAVQNEVEKRTGAH